MLDEWIKDLCGAFEPPKPEPVLERFRESLIAVAGSYVGILEERPNDGPEIRRWLNAVGIDYPAAYCAAFASSCIVEASIRVGLVEQVPVNLASKSWAGATLRGPLPIEPSAGAMKLAYSAGKAFVRRQDEARVPVAIGDLLLWKRPAAGGWAGHVGFALDPEYNGAIRTIEANAPDERGREGVVSRARRLGADPNYLGHVAWSLVPILAGATTT